MRYYKFINGVYLVSIGTGSGGEEITEEEYNAIMQTIQDRPTPPEGKGYRLTTAMEWEEYDLPPVEVDPELSDAEALDIILGGEV